MKAKRCVNWFRLQASSRILLALVSTITIARAEIRPLIPDHDWTFSTKETAWGVKGYGSNTVVLAGSGNIIIPMPFYGVITLGLGGLAVAGMGGSWFISGRGAPR